MARLPCENDCKLTANSEVDALVLAGGKGIRLKEGGIHETPKPLVNIRLQNGREIPMIENAIIGITSTLRCNLVLLTSQDPESRSNMVEDYVRQKHSCGRFSFSIEDKPLGTAGAANNALIRRNTSIGIITPCDTLFPFDQLGKIIKTHKKKRSNITWVLTSNPGDGAQNTGKVFVDKLTGQIIYDFEAGGDQSSTNTHSLKPMTSVGVVIVDKDYYVAKFEEHFNHGSSGIVDLYRQYIPKLLETGERVDSFDIRQPAQDLGTVDRLNRFGKNN
ncbi:MAG: NDP-sugar synthase [Oligoflexia bacterium]|nr:NDP-sugar synthase [Oligoflexia bacterium]